MGCARIPDMDDMDMGPFGMGNMPPMPPMGGMPPMDPMMMERIKYMAKQMMPMCMNRSRKSHFLFSFSIYLCIFHLFFFWLCSDAFS